MAIKLTEHDHSNLDNLLDGILDAYKAGEVSQSQARSALAHVFTAAAIQNEREVRLWLEPDRAGFWKVECGGPYSAMPPASAAKQEPLSQLQILQPRILADLLLGVRVLATLLIDVLRYLGSTGISRASKPRGPPPSQSSGKGTLTHRPFAMSRRLGR